MAEFKRSRRVAELLRHEINDIITKNLKDPLIGMASVSRVMLSDDLKHARIYVSILGDDAAAGDSVNGLTRAGNYIRSELHKRLDLRFIPELLFVHDESAQYAQDIEVLLKRVHREDG